MHGARPPCSPRMPQIQFIFTSTNVIYVKNSTGSVCTCTRLFVQDIHGNQSVEKQPNHWKGMQTLILDGHLTNCPLISTADGLGQSDRWESGTDYCWPSDLLSEKISNIHILDVISRILNIIMPRLKCRWEMPDGKNQNGRRLWPSDLLSEKNWNIHIPVVILRSLSIIMPRLKCWCSWQKIAVGNSKWPPVGHLGSADTQNL